jgi:hypothetical protein
VPDLDYSRIPAGDYGTLIALPLLVLACGGITEAGRLKRSGNGRTAAIWYGGALFGILVCAVPAVFVVDSERMAGAIGQLVAQAVPALVICAALGTSWTFMSARRLPLLVTVVALLSMTPALMSMQELWQLPDAESALAQATGVSSWTNGELTITRLFRQQYTSRPDRTPGEDPLQVNWSGYLAGNFTMGDNGSVALDARENLKPTGPSADTSPQDQVEHLIAANPALLNPDYQRVLVQARGWVFFAGEPHGPDGLPSAGLISTPESGLLHSGVDLSSFMQQGSSLVAIACPQRSCGNLDIAHLAIDQSNVLDSSEFRWQVVHYNRSSIDYHLSLSRPALVIENELFSSGWHGTLHDGSPTPLHPLRVDGSVRGWVLPEGEYDFTAYYSTPLLGLGLALSALAAFTYLLLAFAGLLVFRSRPLVSSGPVGGVQGSFARLPRPPAASTRRGLRVMIAFVAINAVVVAIYFWFATAGRPQFRGDAGYYGWLSDAFLAGQTYLQIDPTPALLNLSNPYDPAQVLQVANPVPDGSLYNGHFYLYFGPVPALVHAAWQIATGRPLQSNVLVFLAGAGTTLWLFLLLRSLRDEAIPHVDDWGLGAVFLCATLGGVGLYLQARPEVHHEAIAAAVFFVIAGCYFWLRALRAAHTGWASLIASGACFGLAVGSRTTEVVYVIGIGLVLLLPLLRRRDSAFHVKRLIAFGAPVALATGLLLLYNYVRFNSPFEFGTRYVLTGLQDLYHNPLGVFDLRAIPNNLLAYLTYVPTFSPYFPWVVTNYSFVPPVQSGIGYAVEPPFASALLLAPLIVFLPVAVAWTIRYWRRLTSATRQFLLSMGIGLVGATAFVLATNFASGRYLEEILPLSGVLAALGFWALMAHFKRGTFVAGRRLLATLGVVLVVWSGCAGGLLAIWELGLWMDAFQSLAYPFDTAEAAIVQRVDDRLWPSTYLEEVPRRRPWGVFYPDGAVVRFTITSRGQAKELNMWSLFPHTTTVRVIVNGTAVGDWPVNPGQVRITFKQPIPADALGRLDIQLAFPDEKSPAPRVLWPITLWSLAEAT